MARRSKTNAEPRPCRIARDPAGERANEKLVRYLEHFDFFNTEALGERVEGVEGGERCHYFSFQEDGEQLMKKAASFGWDLAAAVDSGQLLIHHVPQGNLNLDMLGAAVRKGVADAKTQRVAIDSLAELVFAAREGVTGVLGWSVLREETR